MKNTSFDDMKNIIKLLAVITCVSSAQAQFKRSSDSNSYPVTASPQGGYFYILSRPGVTNYNYAISNTWITATNIAAYQAYIATNDFAVTATNIAAYQSYVATNTGPWLTNLDTRDISFQSNLYVGNVFLATNTEAGKSLASHRLSGSLRVGSGTSALSNGFAYGSSSQALRYNTLAGGRTSSASGENAVAIGYQTIAAGYSAVSLGTLGTANGNYSFVWAGYDDGSDGRYATNSTDGSFMVYAPVGGVRLDGPTTLTTNVVVGGTLTGNVYGATNISGLAFSSTTLVNPSDTNWTITIGQIYQRIVPTTNVCFTNVSGIGSVSVKVLPNGANRDIYFPTNWAWLSTNLFTLSGSQYKTTITNGKSRIGWLSLVSDGANATNVAAMWRQTP